ncbi:MAG: WbqC family protein [Bacteroidota bacterium]
MKVAIIQSNYMPWKGYFDMIHDVDVFCFYDEVKYTKNDWRNRNKIYSINGSFWLTIPINKNAVKQKISEVDLPKNNWQAEHYYSIYQTYRKAPFFQQLQPLLNDFYNRKEWKHLSEFNQYSIKHISQYLGIETSFASSQEFELKGDRVERLLNLLTDLKATEYLSGPMAKDYLNGFEQLFNERNIILTYKDYSGYPSYQQISHTFDPYVSILDMIACVSLETIPDLIWNWRTK